MKKISIALILFVLSLDQISKHLIVKFFSNEFITVKINSLFNLVLTYNTGISFGMFNQTNYSNYIFAVISLIIICFLLKWLKDSVILAEALSLGLVVGGAIGNLIDRLYRPGVVDFIQLHWKEYYWPNFNIADGSICLGVFILMFLSLRDKVHHE